MLDLSPVGSILNEIGDQGLNTFDVNSAADGQRVRGSGRQYVRFYYKKFARPVCTKAKINPVTGSSTPLTIEMQEVTQEFVEIINPGDKNIVDQPAEDYHRREHFRQYSAFKAGKGVMPGKDLDEVSYVPSNVALELKYHGCKTEEQLADASDVLCGLIPNGFQLRDFAKAVVAAESDNKQLPHIMALEEKNRATQAKLDELQEQVAAMMRGEHRIERRGRPRKIVEEGDTVTMPEGIDDAS